jgi:hypothetical protein
MRTGGIYASRIAHVQLLWQIAAVQGRLRISGLPRPFGRNLENLRFAGILAKMQGAVMAKWGKMCK